MNWKVTLSLPDDSASSYRYQTRMNWKPFLSIDTSTPYTVYQTRMNWKRHHQHSSLTSIMSVSNKNELKVRSVFKFYGAVFAGVSNKNELKVKYNWEAQAISFIGIKQEWIERRSAPARGRAGSVRYQTRMNWKYRTVARWLKKYEGCIKQEWIERYSNGVILKNHRLVSNKNELKERSPRSTSRACRTSINEEWIERTLLDLTP